MAIAIFFGLWLENFCRCFDHVFGPYQDWKYINICIKSITIKVIIS